MKNIFINQRFQYSIKIAKLLITFNLCFLISEINAQEQEKFEIKAKENTYIGYGNPKSKKARDLILYHNSKFEIDKIRENRTAVDQSEFSLFRINNHETFLKAFTNTFSNDRIEELQLLNEIIHISFYLDENGVILSVDFTVNAQSNITVFELEKLENELLKQISFIKIIHIKPNSYGLYSIRTNFKQIMAGEINAIKVNLETVEQYLRVTGGDTIQ